MSDTTKAVFLSYASQDAEAARRICEALRAAGVEVWFDQSELRGGDAWDQSIRRQIKTCALFVPVISANTQARAEGYFRLEWKLADDRTQLMARGTRFILPVCVDDTKDWDAIVPDSFTTVQWTRLPAGEGAPAFAERAKKLLSGEQWAENKGPEAGRPRSATRDKGVAPPATKKSRLLWVALAAVAVVAVYFIFKPRRSPEEIARLSESPTLAAHASKASTVAPLSEARQLTAKAWEALQHASEPSRADLQIAEDFCRRAAGIDTTDAEAWAVWSQVETWFVATQLDRSPARRESARTKAARALSLAPTSYEARLAHACFLVRGEGFHTVSAFSTEAEPRLRELLRERPDEPRALLALGHLMRNTKRTEESIQVFDRLARNPDRTWGATALNAKGYLLQTAGRWDEAAEAAEQSIAARPFYANVSLRTYLALRWQGDLDLAKATLERMPAADLMEDFGCSAALNVWFFRREPKQMLRLLAAMPRDWLESNAFNGPKDYWVGVAHQMAGNTDAANLAWRDALRIVERRLAGGLDSGERPGGLQSWRSTLLARLGERAAAEQALALARQLGSTRSGALELGYVDAAITELQDTRWAALRFDPLYDSLRGNPRFQALLAAAERDPKRSPHAKAVTPTAPAAPTADTKSIAVLAFANLSDEKSNEYFSDGISEELLNVLAKVPGLKVSARTSAFYFKGKEVPIPEIAKQLGVAYVVEGSVRKQGDKVRITAQLIKAADGFHVWSDTFTRDLKDIFAVQDEIAGLIAQNLQLRLGADARTAKAVDPEAYRLVLEGRHFWLLRTTEGFARAEAAFNAALKIDPDFAQAHAGLADVWSVRAWYSLLGGDAQVADLLRRAETAALTALRLEPRLFEAHAALGAIRFNQSRYDESERHYEDALRLNPNYSFSHHWRAQLRGNQGRLDDLLAGMDRAIEADPLAYITLTSHAVFLVYAQRHEQALRLSDRALALRAEPFVPLLGQRAVILLGLGRKDEAVAAARLVLGQPQLQPRWWMDAICIHVLRQGGLADEAGAHARRVRAALPPGSLLHATVEAAAGNPREALDLLAANGVASTSVSHVFYAEVWDEARRDRRFTGMLEQLGLGSNYRLARESLARVLAQNKP